MDGIGKLEWETQRRVITLFREELKYRYLGNWEELQENKHIEEGYLYPFLAKSGYTEAQASAAVYKLQSEANNTSRSLYENNKAVYGLLRYGVDVKTEAGKATEKVWLINWKEPEANDFAIAEEVTLRGGHERRPDLVLYVNGLAIGTIELKNSRVSIGEGINQSLSNQSEDVRELEAKPSPTIGDVFVFVDECHRTQSGRLHKLMKAIMPNAVFIGFTGTPLLKQDKSTSLEVFGGYIHTYKFSEAVEDEVVLDLIYEARDIDQTLGSQDKIDHRNGQTVHLQHLHRAAQKRSGRSRKNQNRNLRRCV